MAAQAKPKPKTIILKIVYGIDKTLEVGEEETILSVKSRALELFGVELSELDSYVLKMKGKGHTEEQLDEQHTVATYGLHNKEKVTLSAGSPFGCGA